MRFLILLMLLLAAVIGLAYEYGGIKLGLVTITPTRMFNAQGTSSFSYLNGSNVNGVQVVGICRARSGNVVLRLTDPDGLQVGGQQCPKGEWAINMSNKAKLGQYKLNIEYQHYTGTLDLNVIR